MPNYTELKTAVLAAIKTNNNQEITGQILQNVLSNIISVIGTNSTFAGIATPNTSPGTPDQNVFYLATQGGVYANFGGYKVVKNPVVFNNMSGNWVATELNLLSGDFGDNVVYDMAYGGYLSVDLGHLYSYSLGTGHYVADNLWDAITLRIYNPTGKLEVTGANVAKFVFFDEPRIKDTYLKSNTTGIIPEGAKLCVLDMRKSDNPDGYANLRVRQYASGADRNELFNINQSALQVYSDLYSMMAKSDDQDITPKALIRQWFDPNRGMVINRNYKCYKLNVSEYIGKVLHVHTYTSGTMWSCSMTNENNAVLAKFNYRTTGDGQPGIVDRLFYIVEGAKYLYINCSMSFTDAFIKTTKNIKGGKKLIKLHVYDTEPANGANAFYVRAKYNDTKDILLQYYINNNTLLSPRAAYVGLNTLSDTNLMTPANLVSNHSDSTAPLFQSSLYWHLYAQHGYVIPVVPNTVGLTTADIGALWKDQLKREYNIGNVVGSSIYLLPVITRGTEGNDTRGWKTPNSPVITALTHVSGGTVTTPITVASQSKTQLRPIMKHENRKFYIDGRELTEPGDYEGDDFTVSESQTGYDPASIQTWFPTPGIIGTPDLTGAIEMARFTWSYNFWGAQCCVNTTIDIRRKVRCQSYGATQQQTFVDTGNYKAMFMIPKAANASNGTVLEKPFNSPSLSSTGYSFFRNTTYLKDVDKPIDRLIAMLHNPNDNTYLVGMAAGLSLVSGETIPVKRNANIPIATSTNQYKRLGSFSPSNNNKFYIAAINTAPFSNDDYNLPNTYFKEINYYISYFDPAANPGQCYWYKDGNSYVIYSHCQSVQSRVPLTLPDFMEGLSVEIVEQTDNAVLLTDTVQNGKLFVSYNTDDANYLVLRTK